MMASDPWYDLDGKVKVTNTQIQLIWRNVYSSYIFDGGGSYLALWSVDDNDGFRSLIWPWLQGQGHKYINSALFGEMSTPLTFLMEMVQIWHYDRLLCVHDHEGIKSLIWPCHQGQGHKYMNSVHFGKCLLLLHFWWRWFIFGTMIAYGLYMTILGVTLPSKVRVKNILLSHDRCSFCPSYSSFPSLWQSRGPFMTEILLTGYNQTLSKTPVQY